MPDTQQLFIFSILFILLISLVLHIENQFSSSLEKFKSNLESIKSMNEKSSRSHEENIAKLKKIIEEYDEIKGNNKIQSNQELIPALKIQFLTYISNLKPHLDFLTSKTSEAYHASINTLTTIVEKLKSSSINTLVTIVEKLQSSATQFIKELHKSAIPYIMNMSMWLLSELVKGINAFLQNL